MKKLFLLLLLVSSALSAVGYGGVRFDNNSLHLVYLSPNAGTLLPGDAGLAGTAYDGSALSDGATLVVDFYMGRSASSLSLVASSSFLGSASPGRWSPVNWTPPSDFPRGTTNYFQVQLHESRDASAAVSAELEHYHGYSSVFTSVVSTSLIAYNSIVNLGAPAYSTWEVGSFPLDSVSPGALGAIEVLAVPEPATLALFGLGVGALLLRRRS